MESAIVLVEVGPWAAAINLCSLGLYLCQGVRGSLTSGASWSTAPSRSRPFAGAVSTQIRIEWKGLWVVQPSAPEGLANIVC